MITADIKLPEGIYLDYLAYLFPIDTETGCYQVSNTHILGKLCSALVEETADGKKPPEPETFRERTCRCVTLQLPKLRSIQNLDGKWLFYSPESTERILYVLAASFDLDFLSYYQRGMFLGRQKKDIVEAFIISRQLCGPDPFDALHKRVYRMEQKKMQLLSGQLMRKAAYFDEKINTKGLI